MEQEYIYGVARIRALEGSLFTDETINQLVQCKDYDEAMDFLRTKGWGNGNPDQSLEEMLEQERRRTWKVLDELIEDKEQCEILTIANEYHNLKAAIKQVCTELETENVFYEDTKTDTEFLKSCIRQGNYNLLPKGMEQAAKELSLHFGTAVLVKGGHLLDGADDCLGEKGEAVWFSGERIETENTHGTGCTLSSAIACGLAAGWKLPKAVECARWYLRGALKADPKLGHGNGPVNHCFAIPECFGREQL